MSVAIGMVIYLSCFPIIRTDPREWAPTGDLIAIAPPGTNNHRQLVPATFDKKKGDYVIHCEPNMVQFKVDRVTVRIAESKTDEIRKGLNAESLTSGSLIVSKIMEVRLDHDGSFKVAGLRSAQQAIINGRNYQEWLWDVIPQEVGPHRLYVRIMTPYKDAELGVLQQDAVQETREVIVSYSIPHATRAYVMAVWPNWLGNVGSALLCFLAFLYGARHLKNYPRVKAFLNTRGLDFYDPPKQEEPKGPDPKPPIALAPPSSPPSPKHDPPTPKP